MLKLTPAHLFREVLTSRSHHMTFPSLQQLTATCLWINKHLLIARSDSDQSNPFDVIRKSANFAPFHLFNVTLVILANNLKRYLHEKFSDFTSFIKVEEKAVMDLALRSTYLLFNKELTKFIVPNFFLAEKHNSDFTTYFWNNLLLQCPNLLEFYCRTYYTPCSNHQAPFFNSLMLMQNLQVVELGRIVCDDKHLCTMAEQMPDLR
jgi:hypothetical protein